VPLRELAQEALWDTVMLSGLAFVEEALEADRHFHKVVVSNDTEIGRGTACSLFAR
jgi:hypothetical protein